MDTGSDLRSRFDDLLARHVNKLRIAGIKATGCAPCHDDRSPSFSADLERGVWYCHACAKGGGIKAFAALVGEAWSDSRTESRAARAHRARFQAEQQARAILQHRQDARLDALLAELRPLWRETAAVVGLLALFRRRPDLTQEFSTLAVHTEREYADLLLKLSPLEARLDEVVT